MKKVAEGNEADLAALKQSKSKYTFAELKSKVDTKDKQKEKSNREKYFEDSDRAENADKAEKGIDKSDDTDRAEDDENEDIDMNRKRKVIREEYSDDKKLYKTRPNQT